MDCLRLLLQKVDHEDLVRLKDWSNSAMINDDDFFYQIFEMADNHLLLKIWGILKDYCQPQFFSEVKSKKENYHVLLKGLEQNDEGKTLSAFRELRKLSTF